MSNKSKINDQILYEDNDSVVYKPDSGQGVVVSSFHDINDSQSIILY